MDDIDGLQAIDVDQADAVRRAIALMVIWREASSNDSAAEFLREHLGELLDDDHRDGRPGRLLFGLLALSGQLLANTADLADVDELQVLQSIATSFESERR